MVAEAIEEDAGVDAIVSSLLSSNPYLHDSSRLCPVASGACLWRPGESAFAPSWPQKVPCQNELATSSTGQAQDQMSKEEQAKVSESQIAWQMVPITEEERLRYD